MVLLDNLERLLLRTEVLGEVADLVVEHVGQPLQENERQNVVLELGRINRSADDAGRFPEPGLERWQVESHGGFGFPAHASELLSE